MLIGLRQGLFESLACKRFQRQAAAGEATRLGQRDQLDSRAVRQAGLHTIEQQHTMPLGESKGQPSQGGFNEWRVHPWAPISGGSRRKYCRAI
ncbi:hypothetical protein Pres01_16140 [Metapseudomonas resinovorans]|nr:hypothetical protein Pres01_16140 [Pseudomonas resinovorans]